MNEIDRDKTAEFALGLVPAEEWRALARAADADAAVVAEEIKRWDEALAPLHPLHDAAPPAETCSIASKRRSRRARGCCRAR
jgi:anti-sigma-K factor RskA